jgi:hypothetical protein
VSRLKGKKKLHGLHNLLTYGGGGWRGGRPMADGRRCTDGKNVFRPELQLKFLDFPCTKSFHYFRK